MGEKIAVSRRAILRVAVAAAAFGVVTAASHSFGMQTAAADSDVNRSAGAQSTDHYLRVMSQRGFTDLAGIHAEYIAAVATFPFVLPSGVTFPTSSSLRDSSTQTLWERGCGVAEAYLFWQGAMVSAAQMAHKSATKSDVARILDALEEGYSSPVRMAVMEDAEGLISMAVRRAREGDFDSLVELTKVG